MSTAINAITIWACPIQRPRFRVTIPIWRGGHTSMPPEPERAWRWVLGKALLRVGVAPDCLSTVVIGIHRPAGLV